MKIKSRAPAHQIAEGHPRGRASEGHSFQGMRDIANGTRILVGLRCPNFSHQVSRMGNVCLGGDSLDGPFVPPYVRMWHIVLLIACVTTVYGAPPTPHLLPYDTRAYLSIADVHGLHARYADTRYARLFGDEAMAPFIASVRRGMRFGRNGDLPVVGIAWKQLLRISSGGFCWAVAPVGTGKAGFVLLADASGRDAQVVELLDEMARTYVDNGFRSSKTKTSESVLSEFELQGSTDHSRVWRGYFYRGGILGVSSDEQLARQVLVKLNGQRQKALAELPAYYAIHNRWNDTETESVDIRWFIDPFALEQLVRPARQAEPNERIQRLRAQGFAGIEGVGGVASLSADNYALVHRVVLYHPKPLEKAARALSPALLPNLVCPDHISPDVAGITVFGWDLSDALLAYGSWFDHEFAAGEEGAFEDVLLDIRDEIGGPQVDIRKDLVEQIVGPITRMTRVLDVGSGNAVLLRANTRDSSLVDDSVRRMLEGDPGVRRVPIGEHTVWHFPETAANESAPDLSPDLTDYAICVADGHLLVATDLRLMRSYLQQERPTTLSDDRRFQAAFGELRRNAISDMVGWAYWRPSSSVRVSYDQLREWKPEESGTLLAEVVMSLIGTASPQRTSNHDVLPRFDVSVLPPFDKVKAYLQPCYAYATRSTDESLIGPFVTTAMRSTAPRESK